MPLCVRAPGGAVSSLGWGTWGEQVFEGMMGQTSGELAREEVWQRNLLGFPPLSRSPKMRQQAHHALAAQTPDGWEGENTGFLFSIWSSTPNSLLPLGSHLPARHSNRVQQRAEGCCLPAPERVPSAGGGCLASYPPGCLALTQPPGTNNPPW